MIIWLHKNNFTPFNLGLALQPYHGYGSNHLIETLHAFGICASYPEVREFLTSAANHEITKTDVSCIPYGISPKTLGGDFIQEGSDNHRPKKYYALYGSSSFSGGTRSYTNFRNHFNQD